jgi:hypothetical protein
MDGSVDARQPRRRIEMEQMSHELRRLRRMPGRLPASRGLVAAILLLALAAPAIAQVNFEELKRRRKEQQSQDLRERRLAALREQAAEQAAYPGRGVIHKNEPFWQPLAGFGAGRAIFEGHFASVAPNEKATYYVAFLGQYGNRCEAVVAKDPRRRRITTVTRWCKADVCEPPSETTVLIPGRYAATYEQYRRGIGDTSELVFLGDMFLRAAAGDRSLGLPQALQRGLALPLAIARFQMLGCESGYVKQMMENLYRVAHDQAPVQSTGFTIADAAALSDDPLDVESRVTLGQACDDHYRGFQSRVCQCIDARAPRLSADDLARYTRDFHAFYRAAADDADRPETSAAARSIRRECIALMNK